MWQWLEQCRLLLGENTLHYVSKRLRTKSMKQFDKHSRWRNPTNHLHHPIPSTFCWRLRNFETCLRSLNCWNFLNCVCGRCELVCISFWHVCAWCDSGLFNAFPRFMNLIPYSFLRLCKVKESRWLDLLPTYTVQIGDMMHTAREVKFRYWSINTGTGYQQPWRTGSQVLIAKSTRPLIKDIGRGMTSEFWLASPSTLLQGLFSWDPLSRWLKLALFGMF